MSKPFAHTIKEACTVSRTGRTTLYGAIRRQELVARKLGKKTLILEDDLRRWLEQLPTISDLK
jgi:excisionase family DNA binding protein